MNYKFMISQCSPTLAGIKVGNLFTYATDNEFELTKQIIKMNEILSIKGVVFKILRFFNGKALIYVYRKKQLEKELKKTEIQQFLIENGYEDFSINGTLDILKTHLEKSDFPHEIGIFLGYPLADIKAFIHNKGMNYKCVGCWKVYTDECSAKKIFAKYQKCRDIYTKKYAEGFDILKLTVAS